MRQIVWASLPLGAGVVLDSFMGGGSTIAAALAVGYKCIGVELDPIFFKMAVRGIPKLARLPVNGKAARPLLGPGRERLPFPSAV